jgi:hypothetical protein
MNESRSIRPPLATIICIYEGFIAVFALASPFLVRYLISSNESIARHPHSSAIFTLHSALGWLGIALAVAAAVALWQMRRVAFVLLSTRFAISLVSLFLRLPSLIAQYRLFAHVGSLMGNYTVMIVTYGVLAVEWTISALIVWYVYRITWR